MKSILRCVLVSLAAVLGACALLAGAAIADPPQGMRLYVFSSGWLTLDKSGLQTGATGKITVPVAFFLIKHPKGNVLFDTGNNDKIITDRIASPEMLPEAEMLPHLICSRPMFIGGANDEADQHGGA